MNITYLDGSSISGTTYYDKDGNPVGTVDAEGNIWSNDGNNTFLGNSQADGDGLPSGGSIAGTETSAASNAGSSSSSSGSDSTGAYVQDAIGGLGDVSNIIGAITGKGKTTSTGAKPASSSPSNTLMYFGIGIVLVIIIAVVAVVANKK